MQTRATASFPSKGMPSLSFCVACRNRLWQLEQVMATNLATLQSGHEMVLVDFGSTDGLSSWVWSSFENEIADQRLQFFQVSSEVRWNVSKAKNLAHRLAQGKYLFNLDADNYLTPGDIEKINEPACLEISCQQWSADWPDGSYGRIGIPRVLFHRLGGYDESMLPMGWADTDLMKRILHVGEKLVRVGPPEVRAIQNSHEDKVAELLPENADAAALYRKMNTINREIAQVRLETEGPCRVGGYSSFTGTLNGRAVAIDGFDRIVLLES
jgi:glycosyltransferase involved in cell wall biosynthesis